MTNQTYSVVHEFCKARAEPLETLDTVVLYDTVTMGKRGISVLARLTGILEDDLVEIRPRPWRLDLLQDPGAAEFATQDVSTAHLIVVSTSGHAPLPLAFKIWFTTILKQRQSMGANIAVIALLGLDKLTTLAASPDFHFIEQETLKARFEFFAPNIETPYPVEAGCDSELVCSVVSEEIP